MKKLICALLIACLLMTAALAEGGFKTYDFDSNTVTEEIFTQYDLTVVNVWTTWCPWCIQEMPHFAELKDMLPENVNFITICNDGADEPITAYQILQASGANFTTLMGTAELAEYCLSDLYAYPTTLFIDRGGKVVDEPIVGVPTTDLTAVAEVYYGCAMEVLEAIGSDGV